MIVDSELRHLSVPERFFAYAWAYRNAAAAQCLEMASDHEACTWPNATVVLLLAAHAVELFLKGAILHHDPTADVWHHRIDALSREYLRRFPNSAFSWSVPFKSEYLGMTEAEIQEAEKTMLVPSILYRYPVSKGGEEWKTAIGFVPIEFVRILDQLKDDFDRLKALLLQRRPGELHLWFWELRDPTSGNWRKATYRMTEQDARTRHGDNARKIEGTLEVRGGDPRGLSTAASIMENLPPRRIGN